MKTLEEPPPKSVLILIGTSEQRQLPTIRSRCQVVRFQPLAEADVAALLVERGLCDDPALAQDAAAHSDGSLARAALWCDEGLREFRGATARQALGVRDSNCCRTAKWIGQFVDDAGKESAAKRDSASAWSSPWPKSFIGPRSWPSTAVQPSADAELAKSVAAAPAIGCRATMRPASCLDVCLDAYGHIDANANQATLIEWWLDEVA